MIGHHKTVLSIVMCLLAGIASSEEKKEAKKVGPLGLSPYALVAAPVVQSELNLDDAQKKAIQEVVQEARTALRGVRKLERSERAKKFREVRQKAESKIKEILKEEQLKRFQEIDYQQRGVFILSQRQIAKEVGIRNKQRKSLRGIQQQMQQALRKLRKELQGKTPAERRAKIIALRAEYAQKMLKSLNEEQVQQWKKLQGKPFDLATLKKQTEPRR